MCIHNLIYGQLKHEPIIFADTSCAWKKKGLLHLCRVDQVMVFYPKTMNKWQSKNDQEIFRDQIFIQRIVNFLFRSEKRTSLLHVRNCVVVSYIGFIFYVLKGQTETPYPHQTKSLVHGLLSSSLRVVVPSPPTPMVKRRRDNLPFHFGGRVRLHVDSSLARRWQRWGGGGFQSHITLNFSIKSRIIFFNQSHVTKKRSKYAKLIM